MNAVNALFPNRVVSRNGDIPWPTPPLPRLNPLRLFSLGVLKTKVFETKPRTIADLKQRIQDEVAAIQDEVAAIQDEVAAIQEEVAAIQDEVAAIQDEVAAIQDEVAAIPVQMLRKVINSFRSRLEECVRRNGSHLEGVIFKTQIFKLA